MSRVIDARGTREAPFAALLLAGALALHGGVAHAAGGAGLSADVLSGLRAPGAATVPAGPPMPADPASASLQQVAQAGTAPASVGSLFGTAPAAASTGAAASPPPSSGSASQAAPGSVQGLFGTAPASTGAAAPPAGGASQAAPANVQNLFGTAPGASAGPSSLPIFGFFQSELAYIYQSPGHWEKFRNLLDIGTKGSLGEGMRWHASVRVSGDPLVAQSSYYPASVRQDRRFSARFDETYLDVPGGNNWTFRFGRQQIIWGEMPTLFFADVVSARDLREFFLPELDMIRIPQWAAHAEYFKGNFHAGLIYIPYMTYDNIGKPRDDFFPFRPPPKEYVPKLRKYLPTAVNGDRRPSDNLGNAGYGIRANYLKNGWDGSLFVYTAPSLSPAFGRSVTPTSIVFSPQREREYQFGGTLAKDFDSFVLKIESVYTRNRLFETTDPNNPTGLVRQDFLNSVVGLDFSYPSQTTLHLEVFQSQFFHHASGMIPSSVESGFAVRVSTRYFNPNLETNLLYVSSLNRLDSMLKARANWYFDTNWRFTVGTDYLAGSNPNLFGRFSGDSRVYTELRYTF